MILALVETYQEEENPEISLEHRKLLDQRLADHIADSEAGKDWKILKSGLHKKYGLNKGVSRKTPDALCKFPYFTGVNNV